MNASRTRSATATRQPYSHAPGGCSGGGTASCDPRVASPHLPISSDRIGRFYGPVGSLPDPGTGRVGREAGEPPSVDGRRRRVGSGRSRIALGFGGVVGGAHARWAGQAACRRLGTLYTGRRLLRSGDGRTLSERASPPDRHHGPPDLLRGGPRRGSRRTRESSLNDGDIASPVISGDGCSVKPTRLTSARSTFSAISRARSRKSPSGRAAAGGTRSAARVRDRRSDLEEHLVG